MAASSLEPPLPPRPAEQRCDVLVVGGGPAGAAAAYWLASAGADVVLVERKRYPRDKTCGDGLTPRSVRQLEDMGLAPELARHHRYDGLRAHGFGRVLELRWPPHPSLPSRGYVVRRADLDALVAARAEKAGAQVWQGMEAVAPLCADAAGVASGGPVPRDGTAADPRAPAGTRAGGALVLDRARNRTSTVRARYVLVADGANSRVGRALGTHRRRDWPQGMAIRGYFLSPRHDEPFIESHLDVRERDGAVVPGYGWVFPLGDGRVNVGVGLLSTFDRWRSVNTTQLYEAFVRAAPASWCLSPSRSLGPPSGGRLPMGLAVGPRSGVDWLAAGDAAGAINPFNGEGIAYAYETGRLAAEVLLGALDGRGELGEYEEGLQGAYGLYYRVGRGFVTLLGRPRLLRALVGTGMQSRSLMEWVLRIMANLLRPDELGPAELAWRAVVALSRSVQG